MSMNSRLTLCVLLATAGMARAVAGGAPLETPLSADDLDAAAFVQWVDGVESAMPYRDGPRHVMWTRTSRPEWDGVRFGDGKRTEARHLRIGFHRAIEVGTVLARAGGRLSVLKPGAAYPGDVNDETLWMTAERLDVREVSSRAAGSEDLTMWVLPPGTTTRALRFTHVPVPTDKSYAGTLGAAWVLAGRVTNVAPQAVASTKRNPDTAYKINNSSNDHTWIAWDNGGAGEALSAENYEPLTLVWPGEVRLRGMCAIWSGAASCEVLTYTGPASRHPRDAEDSDWQRVSSFDGMECGYPLQMWPNWMDFGRTLTTRALQVRITSTTRENHPHMNGRTKGGKFTWMGELMALVELDDRPLASTVLAAPSAPDLGHPPIPVTFTLAEERFVTLVIDDAEGNRVRNLVSETRFPAGRNTVWWDATDDLGRDIEAARHGLYSIPAAFVKPGSYTVRGLTRKELDLRFEFSVYNGGSPAWTTEDHTGGWTTNHTRRAACSSCPLATLRAARRSSTSAATSPRAETGWRG